MDLEQVSTVLDLLSGVAYLVLGAVVLALSGRRRPLLLLAAYLLLNTLYLGSWIVHVGPAHDDPRWAYNVWLLVTGLDFAGTFLYLAFFSSALAVAWLRPFHGATGSIALCIVALIALLAPFVAPAAYFPTPGIATPDGWVWEGTVLANEALTILLLGGYSLGVVAAWSAWRRSPAGSITRRQSRLYLIAFGYQDLVIVAYQVISLVDPALADAVVVPYQIALGVIPFLLGYVALRYELFDLDLRVKWTLKRTTVAGIFVGVFFVVSQLIEAYAGQALGVVAGAIASGLLLFALSPLQRMAERVADAAMPATQETPAYVQFKKMEVYRAAVESAWEGDGTITERERGVLTRLRRKLGVPDADAAALEAEVMAARSGSAPLSAIA